MRHYLAAGTDVNWRDKDGRTALWLACWEGHLAVVRCLVEEGADVELADTEDTTPFSVACENGRLAVVRYLAKVTGLWRGLLAPRGNCYALTDCGPQHPQAATPRPVACHRQKDLAPPRRQLVPRAEEVAGPDHGPRQAAAPRLL